jgi:hypothetical protein
MAKFLIVARDQARYDGLSPEQVQRLVERYIAWTQRQRDSGALLGSNKLRDGEGRVVKGSKDGMAVKDGPFSETKEIVAGYWLVEAKDYDEVVANLHDHPHLQFGSLEVRAVEGM